MNWLDVPASEKSRMARAMRDNKLTQADADPYQLSLSALRKLLHRYREDEEIVAHAQVNPIFFAPKQRTYQDHIVLNADNVIITSDWEWPDTDIELVESTIYLGMAHNIRTLVIAGDLISGDQEAFNTWAEIYVESGDMNFGDELDLLTKALKQLALWFDEIIFISGNHDERLQKATRGQISLITFLRYSNPEIKTSLYRKMYLRTHRGDYKITHPKNYSRVPVKLAQQLAVNDRGIDGSRIGCIAAHTHHMGIGTTLDGELEAVTLGCMRDPLKTKYKQMGDATNPEWNQGYLMIRDGFFYPMWKDMSDWRFWLGDYADRCELGKQKAP